MSCGVLGVVISVAFPGVIASLASLAERLGEHIGLAGERGMASPMDWLLSRRARRATTRLLGLASTVHESYAVLRSIPGAGG
jgi:hypothetical protein